MVGLRENVYKTPASTAEPALVAIISSVTHACHQLFPFFPGFSESAQINQVFGANYKICTDSYPLLNSILHIIGHLFNCLK